MKLKREILPHLIIVERNNLIIENKNGLILKKAKIKRITQKKLAQLAFGWDGIVRNDKGRISKVYLYELDKDTDSSTYLSRLKLLGNININQL
ncbi:hypothetical protein [Maribacter sp. 1_2014MBL_MicDiv]|uniref:hypothetical protein n=1 Tax=Maribacter sp. 1_2014MBL_MicDiv TaxID=1644130 RepID=UPI0008F4D6B8|nr:hypothetical protein [Maribacter sp. 1_2014MBL_MicDiv]APA65648.1 hypothetical protein YQ22_15800 [Maribacter sp. 1_2014MBL_MicDiv]